jgi:hypothetical protein
MSNLVYLISSLPSLSFAEKAPMTLEEFHKDAKMQLGSKQLKKLEQADLRKMEGKASGDLSKLAAMLDEVKGDKRVIRESGDNTRQVRLNAMPDQILHLNPLEREKAIMEWQWEALDDMVSGKTFSFAEVLVYKLKLQILLRLQSFNTAKGLAVLDSVVNAGREEDR